MYEMCVRPLNASAGDRPAITSAKWHLSTYFAVQLFKGRIHDDKYCINSVFTHAASAYADVRSVCTSAEWVSGVRVGEWS
jgi:hypothetical protein